MAAQEIQAIFVDPPIAVARLGGSSVPMDAFTWVESPEPRSPGETTLAPALSLSVQADGSVVAAMPPQLVFRDGPLIRPVAPFFEIWAVVGEGSNPDSWSEVPLTREVLKANGTDAAGITLHIEAMNRKVARRMQDADLRYGTFPAVEVAGDEHQPVALLAVSPPRAAPPMIPKGKSISLGFLQVTRSVDQPPSEAAVVPEVNLAVVRFRFTPAPGHFYGPRDAGQPQRTSRGQQFPPVDPGRTFLDGRAGWQGGTPDRNLVNPWDTYDGAESRGGRSFGVVDDTCEVRIEVRLSGRRGRQFVAHANVFVGPPDFSPDRRPFLSLADELNDRQGGQGLRSNAMRPLDLDAWVEDLFERVYETVSLFNVDHWRSNRAADLAGPQLRATPIQDDRLPRPTAAMGSRDLLRDPNVPIPAATPNDPLPLTRRARTRHRDLSDLQALQDLVGQDPGRIRALVRAPFEVEVDEQPETTTMRMPPFMKNSNAQPLTLAAWQHDLLMTWVAAATTVPGAAPSATRVGRTGRAEARAMLRRTAVLERLSRPSGRPGS